jgi:hypothetical protein
MLQNPAGDALHELYTMRVCLLSPVQRVSLDRIKPIFYSLQSLLNGRADERGWYMEAKAMLEIREGNPAGALETLSEIDASGGFRKGPIAVTLLAMAHLKLGEFEAADADVAAAQKEIGERWPAPLLRSTYWHEWLLAQVLLDDVKRQLRTLPRASR